MLYVVDASVLIKWLVPEPLSDRAEGLAIAFRRVELDLVAPDIVAAEVGHSLRRLVLRDALDVTEYALYLSLAPPRRSHRVGVP